MRILMLRAVRSLFLLLLVWIPASSLFAAYTVTGRFVYEDRAFDLDGFTGVISYRPIRFADVRILANGTTIATGTTTHTGDFLVQVPDVVVPSISALCVTSSAQSRSILLSVRVANDDFSFGDYYSVSSATYQISGPSGIVSMGTTVAKASIDTGKAFNIWDVLVDGLEFVSSSHAFGSPPNEGLTVLWRETHNRTGSFFQGSRNRYIYIGSTSAYNDTVIAHEFGHFIDALFSKSNSPGGQHTLGDDTQDIRLSWAEGLATYLGCSIRKFKGYPRPEIYVSTDGTNLSFSYELESFTGSISLASKTGSTNEAAVSAALWDITDGRNTDDISPGVDDDPIERPFAEVWRDLTQYLPAVAGHDPNIEDYWDGWFAVHNGGSLMAIQMAFAGNGIEFIPDALEADNSVAEAPVVGIGKISPLANGFKILINEVDVGGVDAVELYNAGNREVDLIGWKMVASARGFPTATFVMPRFRLAPGAFVVLSEASGSNTGATLFFNNNISWANGSDGACALFDNLGEGCDFVRWGDSAMEPPSGTRFHGTNPASPAAGKDLCRSFSSVDTDTGSDWPEQSPSLGTFNPGGNMLHHTYYPDRDADIIAFDAAADAEYLVETFNLSNGAFTALDILAHDGITVLASTDEQPVPSKAGLMRWTAPTSGRYYVHSRRFKGEGNLARYGSYDLRILTKAPLCVSKEPGSQFDSVSEAIAASLPGDTIEIRDSNIYFENAVIAGKNLTLRAAPGRSPVLDGGRDLTRPALEVNAEKVRIEGIRIRHGAPGILVSGGSATIINTVVYQASGPNGSADGVRIEGSFANAALIHCTIAINTGLGVGVFSGGSARIANSIIAGNIAGDLFDDGTARSLTVTYSLIESIAAPGLDGNLNGDPRFADRRAGDFHLAAFSPAIDRGAIAEIELPTRDADGITRNLDGNRDRLAAPDMGAYEFLPDEILSDLSLFPQVAVGGGYRTSLIAMNPGGQDAQVRWHLSDSNGSPVSEAVLVLNYNQPALSIPPLGFARVEVGAAGDTISGYAQLRGSIPINGAALLQMVGAGRVASEAAVGPATAVGQFIIYVDNTRGARSGYALANPSSVPANLNLTLRNKNGLQVANMIFRLPAGGHVAEFADERFAAAGIGFEGTIEFTGDQALHAVALRYDNEAGDAMSAIPVLADRLDSVLYFPQVADGADYRTNLILINPDDRSANVKLEFFAADGSPLSLPIGGTFQTKLNLTLDPKGCRSLLTDGIGTDIKAGWVRVTSSVPMGGSSVIQTRAGSKVGSEAGMSPSNAAKRFLAYLESRGYARSGVAICNPGAESVSLTLRLRNAAGEIVAARSLILPGLGQAARFFTDWFPLFDDFEGTLEVLCSTPVAAVALRYDNLLADVFAALPVVIIQ